jgi:hypothetical protein
MYKKILEAKKEIGKATKNATNPHFKNKYVDINALIETVEGILLSKGLVLLQPIENGKVYTRIVDAESKEMIESFIDLPIGGTPQSMGSAITYYRRYTLQSLLSMQAQDDDGQLASQPQRKETIDNDRFEKALEKIKEGSYTVEKLKATFELTELQTKSLLLL